MLNQNYDYEPTTGTVSESWEPTTYDRDGRLAVAPHQHLLATPAIASVPTTIKPEQVLLSPVFQAVQQTQQQQMYLLREMDARLARLEENARVVRYDDATRPVIASAMSFERSSWWAIWGLLMLIMGAALAVIIILLVSQIQLR